jgi:hypothetical protein
MNIRLAWTLFALALCTAALLALPLQARASDKAVTAEAPGASATPSPEALERGLAGNWAGALEYRDYQSNRAFELPVRVSLQVGPDNATLIRVARFDDGPKSGFVHITTVSLFSPDGTQLSSASFRKGRAVETSTQKVNLLRYHDAQHWALVYLEQGFDGDKPAALRVTQTRDGDSLVALKEVKPVDAPDSAYAFRNTTRLLRLAPQ